MKKRGRKVIMKKQILALTCAVALLISGNSSITASAASKKPVSLSGKTITLKAGKSKTLKVKKSGKVKIKSKTFKSSNKKIATVTKKTGKIKAKKAGKATITVKVKYVKKPGKKVKTITLKCKVKVTAAKTPVAVDGGTREPAPSVVASTVPTEVPYPESTASFDDFSKAAAELVKENKTANGSSIAANNEFFAKRLIVKGKNAELNFDEYKAKAVVKNDDNIYLVQFATSSEAKSAMAELSNLPEVEYVEPDAYSGTTVDLDIDITDSKSWGVSKIGADKYAKNVASNTMGEVEVAVVDTGVSNHPFLEGRISDKGLDFVDIDETPHDLNSHGTHVAGTIVDCTPNLNVTVIPVRVLDEDGHGYSSIVGMGIRYAANCGAKVINLSLGGGHSQYIDGNIQYAISKGVTVVVAAGNEYGNTADYCPSHMTDAIVVGAVDENDSRAGFSNIGSSLDVVAPGVRIVSCVPGGGYKSYQGTSMATPHISAIAAMLTLVNPKKQPSEIEEIIKGCTRDLGEPGWDKQYGHGIPDLSSLCIAPTKITLDKSSLSMNIGDTETLTATILPDDASDKTVTWSSSDSDIASVQNGTVKAKAEGTAVITAETSNGKTAVCSVTVKNGISTYKLYDSPMSWAEAKEYCESQGGHLVTITSQYENDIIMDLIKTGNKESYWIGGLLQEGKWKWCNGEYFEYSSWEEGEPNNYLDRGENCITIRPSTCTWYDSLMTGDPTGIEIESMGFVCEWETLSSAEPTQITLNKTTETINVGDAFSLIATILPNNVLNKTVSSGCKQ